MVCALPKFLPGHQSALWGFGVAGELAGGVAGGLALCGTVAGSGRPL